MCACKERTCFYAGLCMHVRAWRGMTDIAEIVILNCCYPVERLSRAREATFVKRRCFKMLRETSCSLISNHYLIILGLQTWPGQWIPLVLKVARATHQSCVQQTEGVEHAQVAREFRVPRVFREFRVCTCSHRSVQGVQWIQTFSGRLKLECLGMFGDPQKTQETAPGLNMYTWYEKITCRGRDDAPIMS